MAGVTLKSPVAQFQCLQMSAGGALASGTFKAPDLNDHLAAFSCHLFDDAQKGCEGQIADLAPPKRLHTLKVQILKTQNIKLIKQLMRQLEVGIAAFVRHADMGPAYQQGGFLAVICTVRLLILAALQSPQPLERVKMILPRCVLMSC